mmetsp:Transcript_114202/g.329870  ORF Transcript_114202/g.329870 Transcript_114202/m.329870 type:complete len:453 (+) Transcript_114202:2286-3644(+)
MLHELSRARNLWRRESVGRQLLVGPFYAGDSRWGGGRRPAASNVQSERQGSALGGHAESELNTQVAAHGEADKHVLRATEIREDRCGECVEQRLVVGIVGWHALLGASAPPRELDGHDLHGLVGDLRPRREDRRRAAREGQAIGADRGLLLARLAKPQQRAPRHRRLLLHDAVGDVGRGCRILGGVHVDRALGIRPQRRPVENVGRQPQQRRRLDLAQHLGVERAPIDGATRLPQTANRAEQRLGIVRAGGLRVAHGLHEDRRLPALGHALGHEDAQRAAGADLQDDGRPPLGHHALGVLAPMHRASHVLRPVVAVAEDRRVQPAARLVGGDRHRGSARLELLLRQAQATQHLGSISDEPRVEGLPHVQLRRLPPGRFQLRLQGVHGLVLAGDHGMNGGVHSREPKSWSVATGDSLQFRLRPLRYRQHRAISRQGLGGPGPGRYDLHRGAQA